MDIPFAELMIKAGELNKDTFVIDVDTLRRWLDEQNQKESNPM